MPEALEMLQGFLADGAEAGADAGEAVAGGAEQTGGAVVKVPEETQKKVSTQKKAATPLGQSASKLGAAVPQLGDFPTGGVAFLLVLALFVVFAIIPAPGHTGSRLSLIWASVLGNATLGPRGTTSSTTAQGTTVPVWGGIDSAGNWYATPGL